MNWGNKIVVAFVLFAAFILYMVVQAFNENFDLVANDYYAQEINYQQKLEQKANLAGLDQKVKVRLNDGAVVLVFPEDHQPVGQIYFYHPSREMFDQKHVINTDGDNQQIVRNEDFVAAFYRINITWESDGQEYFQQEKIFIQ